MDFAGQHIVVTGGSSGIGLVTARLLAKRGAAVTLIARRSDQLEAAKQEMGGRTAWAAADVGDKAQLEAALDAAVHQNGPIHGLFANAGLTGGFTPAVQFDNTPGMQIAGGADTPGANAANLMLSTTVSIPRCLNKPSA